MPPTAPIFAAIALTGMALTVPVQMSAAPATGSLTDAPGANPLPAAVESSGHPFSPQVKAAYLAARKAQAIADIAKAGHTLPADFLAWVDSNPVVATTVYGLINPGSRATGEFTETRGRKIPVMGADTPAQRLVFLRSLEIDLGSEDVRQLYPQLALAFTHFFAGGVDVATMTNRSMKVDLKPRALFKLQIPGDPRVRVAPSKPLDINDHILSFLAANPVVTEKKVTTMVDGKKVESLVKSPPRPRHAYEVYSNPEMVKKFNAYMSARGFPMDLDCGKGNIVPAHWGGGRDIVRAYKLFRTAYEAKGLLPKAHDPRPAPVELAAYLIRNDKHRFPENVKRGWPKFNLNSPWPILQWLVTSGESLREREHVWSRFCATGSVTTYGAYIGDVAQYPDLVKARKLQPFEFCYDTYPMRVKDGGVCGTCSNIGRFANTVFGIPSAQASQPSHSCFVSIGGNEQRGFAMSVGQSVGNPTYVSGVGRIELAIARMVLPVNYGLMPLLDSRIAMQLAAEVSTPDKKLAMVTSAFAANPYNLEAVTACLNAQTQPRQLVEFWQNFNDTLSKVDKPGCPKTSSYNSFVVKPTFDALLAKMPPPSDPKDVGFVAASLSDRSDALWLKYQIALSSLPALKSKLLSELKASVEGTRSRQSTALLSARLAIVGASIKDPTEKRAWAKQLIEIIGDKPMFTVTEGKKSKEYFDPCADTARSLAGNSPDARLEFETALKSAVSGVRTAGGCNLMVKRLTAIAKDFKNPKEKKAWADSLYEIIDGHETFAPPNAPQSLMLDPIVKEIYALGCDMGPARKRLETDLRASIAGPRQAATLGLLAARLTAILQGSKDAKAHRAWAEASLLPVIVGKEYYTVALPKNKGVKELVDPCATLIYRTLGKKVPSKEKPASS